MDSVLAILGGGAVLCLMIFLLRYIYSYRIRGLFFEIVIFHFIPIYRLHVKNIESVSIVSWVELGVGGATVRAGNRLARHGVLIRKRRGIFRRIAITPENPAGFVEKLRSISIND